MIVLSLFCLFLETRFTPGSDSTGADRIPQNTRRSGADTDSFCLPCNLRVCSAKHDIKRGVGWRLCVFWSFHCCRCWPGHFPLNVKEFYKAESVLSPPPLVPAPGRNRPHKCSAARRKSDPMAIGEPPPLHRRLRAQMEALSPQPGRCY